MTVAEQTLAASLAERIRGGLIVSCQYSAGDAFESPDCAARFALAACSGGAVGIRANGPQDIAAIVAAAHLPVVGILKRVMDDGRVLITPELEDARELVQAGASAVALDCTARGQRFGALERLQAIRRELGVPVFADIATEGEALAAAAAGADFVLSTLRGYTEETAHIRRFASGFIVRLVEQLNVPVIAEGMIAAPAEAGEAIRAGAFAVIVGTAITRPHELTRAFARAVRAAGPARPARLFAALDLGSTNTKRGLVDSGGQLLWSAVQPTPARDGRDALLAHAARAVQDCVAEAARLGRGVEAAGIATSGWADPRTGAIAYATSTMPGWTGAPLAAAVQLSTGLAVAVDNDARAAAVGERLFGAARHASDFLCLTLGTGVGGGVFSNGSLVTGASALGSALGHIQVAPDGEPCPCGARGCLEVYASQRALLAFARPAEFRSARELIAAASHGDEQAAHAIRTLAGWLAAGCASLVAVLDPELIVLAGGVAQDNPLLVAELQRRLAADGRVFAPAHRRLRVQASALGYEAGLLGAAALAMQTGEL